MAHDWTKLTDLLCWLQADDRFRFKLFNHETSLCNALRSKKVPMRGRKGGPPSDFDRIELKLSEGDKIFPSSNFIQQSLSRFSSFEDVQADKSAVETWLIDNVLDDSLVSRRRDKPTRSGIDKLRDYLSRQDRPTPPIKTEFFNELRDGKIDELGNHYSNLTRREFDRIWGASAPTTWRLPGFRRGRSRKTKTSH